MSPVPKDAQVAHSTNQLLINAVAATVKTTPPYAPKTTTKPTVP